MLRIPENFVHTRSTPFWNKDTAPKALFTHHNTKASVYGRLSVMQGAVRYFGFPDADATEPDLELVIEAGSFGISPPEKWHRIELLTDDTYFNIDFFADPDVTLQGAGIGKVVKHIRSNGVGKSTYTVTVTNNSNGVSVDYETETPMELLIPDVAANVVKDLVNTVRAYDTENEHDVCGW